MKREPERGYGWLAGVIPAEARRFRVADAALTDNLREAGAELTRDTPDVEIGEAARLRGDAAVSIAVVGRPRSSSRWFAVRLGRRLADSARVRLSARVARRAVRRLGYPVVDVFTWDEHHTLRSRSASTRRSSRLPLREHFPRRALVVGRSTPPQRPLLAEVLDQAESLASIELDPRNPAIRTGLLIAHSDQAILRVAVGFGARQIRSQRRAIAALVAADAPPLVAARLPAELANGRCGLAEWSLERRLPGSRPAAALSEGLLDDCVDSVRPPDAPPTTLVEDVEVVAPAVGPDEAQTLRTHAIRLDAALTGLPRGFAHGDFFHGNLLADGGRLVGVIDWDAASPGRLPLLDLLHLRHTTERLDELDWGPRLVENLLPWARGGGDDVARRYCERLGISPSPEELEAIVVAYWLDRLASQLRSHAHRLAQPVWLERNLSLVLGAVTAGPWPRVSAR
jgi:hypothetical protein